jgi:hypothetical protein
MKITKKGTIMGLSTNTTTYAGGAQTFAVNFALGFLSRADVQVRVNAAVDGSGDPVYTSFSWIDDSAISVIPTLTIGDTVEVLRTVSKTALSANFAANTDVTPANLDISAKQGLMVYQELIDGRVEGTESPIVAGNRAEAAALAAEADAALTAADRVQTGLDAAAAALSAANVSIDQGVSTTDSPTFVNGTFTGNITPAGTVDGRDLAIDGAKLDAVEALADVTDTTNVNAAGALMDSELTDIASVKALNQGLATTDSPTFDVVTATSFAGDGSALTGLVLTKEYVSSQQTVSNGLRLTLAHGLGARPKLLTFHLICVTDDNGFTAGDEIKVEPQSHTSNNDYTFSFWLDDTSNINIEFGTETPIFKVINKAGVRAILTNANWKFVARGWL